MSELLEQLKKKPVPGTAKHKPVTVAPVAIVKEDETTSQAESGRRPLAVSVTMKRPAAPYDRAAFLERIKSRSVVASKRSPEPTAPAAPPAPTKAKRGRKPKAETNPPQKTPKIPKFSFYEDNGNIISSQIKTSSIETTNKTSEQNNKTKNK